MSRIRVAPVTLQRNQQLGSLALVAAMGALGNVLGTTSIILGQIPTPGVTQVALDFSSVAVVVVAIFVGWRLGALTGFIAGLGPMIMFGYVYGSTGLITILLPMGKALTGFFVGLIAQSLGPSRRIRTPFVMSAILVGFIPEAILTWFYFTSLVPVFVPNLSSFAPTLALPVVVKSWAEMIIIGFLTVALIGNTGFKSFMGRFVPTQSI